MATSNQYKLNWDHYMTIFEPFYITDKRKKVYEILEASNEKFLESLNAGVEDVEVEKVVKLVEDVNEKIKEIPSETISPSALLETATIVHEYLLELWLSMADVNHLCLAMCILICGYVFFRIIGFHGKPFIGFIFKDQFPKKTSVLRENIDDVNQVTTEQYNEITCLTSESCFNTERDRNMSVVTEQIKSSQSEVYGRSHINDDNTDTRSSSHIPDSNDSPIQQLLHSYTHDTNQLAEVSRINDNDDMTLLDSHHNLNRFDEIDEIKICSSQSETVFNNNSQTSFLVSDEKEDTTENDKNNKDQARNQNSNSILQITTNTEELSSNSYQSDTSITIKEIKLALAGNSHSNTTEVQSISSLLHTNSISSYQSKNLINEDNEVANINNDDKSNSSSNYYYHSFRPLNLNESPINSSSHDDTVDGSNTEISGDISKIDHTPQINYLHNFTTRNLLEQLPPLKEMKFVDNTTTDIKYDGSLTCVHSNKLTENRHRIVKSTSLDIYELDQWSTILYSRMEEFTLWGRVFGFNSPRIPTMTTTLSDVTDVSDDDAAATDFDFSEFDDCITSDDVNI